MVMPMDQPTTDQCTARARVGDGYACWYPQMGGYASRAVVVPDGHGCADVYVWHDGDFPFDDGSPPTELHHCDGRQFVDFGNFLIQIEGRATTTT